MAARFINSTGSHVFLTGKAGTGKTTFLRQLAEKTHKSYLIVAPTGIAALNAGGVTIHSQFLFPFGSFIPDQEAPGTFNENIPFYNRQTLTRLHPLNSMRKKVLQATELLIIDEVSMLRADILDAIDFRMRRAKGDYSHSFGGTQLLMIGDLHQLPPIVKDEEWQVLRQYYRSMHFFEARAFREERMVFIELDRIFRQRDERFIEILNHLRDNQATAEDITLLNSHFQSQVPVSAGKVQQSSGDEEPIIITTHNRTADSVNSGKLESLPSPSFFFEAEIDGKFPEKLYPLPLRIEFKAGMQLMFVRNDSSEEKAYVNGSLARILRIEDEEVTVEIRESGLDYVLKKEQWENKKYILNEERNEVEEQVIGTFGQFPVRPAWAVTVHKSQGLTFDKAVIDVGQAFAPGQVYVALSRLRSLDGLILRTRIHPSCIMSDKEVNAFTGTMEKQKPLPELLQENQRIYLGWLLSDTFEFAGLMRQLENLQKYKGEKIEFEDEEMRNAMGKLKERFASEQKNTVLFRKQLTDLLKMGKREFLLERLNKGRVYYTAFMEENLRQILFHMAEVEQLTRTKTYRNVLGELEQQITNIFGKMERVENLVETILLGRDIKMVDTEFRGYVNRRRELRDLAYTAASENPKFRSSKSGRKRKKGAKLAKGESSRITWAMVKEGSSVAELAGKRELALSTIEGHIVRGISAGEVDVFKVLNKERVEEISALLKEADDSIGETHKLHKRKYSYSELRMVNASRNKDKNRNIN